MPGHRQLLPGRENAHADIGPGSLGGQDERGFGEVHLARQRLHLPGGEPCRVGKDGELIALKRPVGKDIVMEVAHGVDPEGLRA
jgi:hypothetical protein